MRIHLGSLRLPELAATIERKLARVPESEFVRVTSPGTADQPFIVKHSLGVVPTFASAMAAAEGVMYVPDADRMEWTATQIKVRFPVANTALVVKVEV